MSDISSKAASSTPNKIKYNGKELQNGEFSDGSGLKWTDYGGRMYDAQIGRWNVIDLFNEVYSSESPYQYVENNPVRFIDVEGMFRFANNDPRDQDNLVR